VCAQSRQGDKGALNRIVIRGMRSQRNSVKAYAAGLGPGVFVAGDRLVQNRSCALDFVLRIVLVLTRLGVEKGMVRQTHECEIVFGGIRGVLINVCYLAMLLSKIAGKMKTEGTPASALH
jgi:hypothetical protein